MPTFNPTKYVTQIESCQWQMVVQWQLSIALLTKTFVVVYTNLNFPRNDNARLPLFVYIRWFRVFKARLAIFSWRKKLDHGKCSCYCLFSAAVFDDGWTDWRRRRRTKVQQGGWLSRPIRPKAPWPAGPTKSNCVWLPWSITRHAHF